MRDGYGTYTWANGEKYEGQFASNVMSGKGVYTWPGGRTYEGYFENGVIVRAE